MQHEFRRTLALTAPALPRCVIRRDASQAILVAISMLRAPEHQRRKAWARMAGYCRPISEFNPGNLAGHAEHKPSIESIAMACCRD